MRANAFINILLITEQMISLVYFLKRQSWMNGAYHKSHSNGLEAKWHILVGSNFQNDQP